MSKNVYVFDGNLEKAIKNGDFQNIILISEINNPINKILTTFSDIKEIEKTNDFNYRQSLIKFRSPFRIGTLQIRTIVLDNIIDKNVRNSFNLNKLEHDIKNISKKYKNNIILLPLSGQLINSKDEILENLQKTIKDTKVIIATT